MKKKEIASILKPYWLEYLENNNELERDLQLKKFVESLHEMERFGFYNFLNIDKYITFRISNFFQQKKFWGFSKVMAKLKKDEKEIESFKEKFESYLTQKDTSDLNNMKFRLSDSFSNNLSEYFENTLGSQDRELRLWCTYEISKYLKGIIGN